MGLCRESTRKISRPPVRLMREGEMDASAALLLNQVRTPEEREGDLGAADRLLPYRRGAVAGVCALYGIQPGSRERTSLYGVFRKICAHFCSEYRVGTIALRAFWMTTASANR